jgi:phosphohistidine phosphatase
MNLPDAPNRLQSVLQDLPAESCVICIGHEPHLGMAASVLLQDGRLRRSPEESRGLSNRAVDPGKARSRLLHWWLTPVSCGPWEARNRNAEC